jgi:hypothetical protein
MLRSYILDTPRLKAIIGILYRHAVVKYYINIINSLSGYKNLR